MKYSRILTRRFTPIVMLTRIGFVPTSTHPIAAINSENDKCCENNEVRDNPIDNRVPGIIFYTEMINFPQSRLTGFSVKRFTRPFLIVLLAMVQIRPLYAELGTIMSLGVGHGESHSQGDYTENLSNRIFAMGFDYDYQQGLFLARGQSSTKNDFKQMDLIFGYGSRHIKIGTGFVGIQTSIPQNPTSIFDTSGVFTADTNRRIDLSITTIPLYLRLKHYVSDNFILIIDGYYGLYSHGSMTFPVFYGGSNQYATVSSVPKKQGGAEGYSVAAIWRLDHKSSAICLEYQYREATMVKKTSAINTDVFGLIGSVTTPQLTFQSSAVMLKYVLVK